MKMGLRIAEKLLKAEQETITTIFRNVIARATQIFNENMPAPPTRIDKPIRDLIDSGELLMYYNGKLVFPAPTLFSYIEQHFTFFESKAHMQNYNKMKQANKGLIPMDKPLEVPLMSAAVAELNQLKIEVLASDNKDRGDKYMTYNHAVAALSKRIDEFANELCLYQMRQVGAHERA